MIFGTLSGPIVVSMGIFHLEQKSRKGDGIFLVGLGLFFIFGGILFLSGEGLIVLKLLFLLEIVGLSLFFLVRFISGRVEQKKKM